MMKLLKERRRLYRSAPESKRIVEVTEELKPIRKGVRMCSRIEVHSLEIEKSLKQMEEWEKKQIQQKEEAKDKQEEKER